VRFDVTVLGCGAATPTERYQPTSQILNISEKWYLLDAGEGVQIALRSQRVPFQKIEQVFISHMHGDHVLGLPGLIGSMNLLGRRRPLILHGPVVLERWLMECLRLTSTYLNFELEFSVNNQDQIDTCWLDGDIQVLSAPVKHRVEAYGYRFNWTPKLLNLKKQQVEAFDLTRSEVIQLKNGQNVQRENGQLLIVEEMCYTLNPGLSYVFSGDTAPCVSLDELAEGANLLYHEATFMESLSIRAKQTGHSTSRQAANTALKAGVDTLLLGHFSSRYRSLKGLLDEAFEVFESVQLAEEKTCYDVQSFCRI
tara:strand:- start:1486 stop:2415 length:930 start_codon:yes stop_codon:yes gene_type:complete